MMQSVSNKHQQHNQIRREPTLLAARAISPLLGTSITRNHQKTGVSAGLINLFFDRRQELYNAVLEKELRSWLEQTFEQVACLGSIVSRPRRATQSRWIIPVQLLSVVCCCLLLAPAQAETAPSLSVPQKQIVFGAVSHSHNIIIEPGNRASGLIPEIIYRVFAETGIEIDYRKYPSRRLFHEAEKGSLSVFSVPIIPRGFSDYPDTIVLGNTPYMKTNFHVFSLKTSNFELTRIADLVNYRTGIAQRAKVLDKMLYNLAGERLDLLIFSSLANALKGLLAGRVQFILGTQQSISLAAKALNVKEGVVVAVLNAGELNHILAFSKLYFGEDVYRVRDWSDQKLEQLHSSGVIREIVNRHYDPERQREL